jgi:molybdenum cofactor cytidylyltransferase
MEKERCNIVTIVLAAGASTRMGQPKQLLPWGDSFLLKHTIQTVLKLKNQEVIVVLGANFESIKKEISDCSVTVLNNTAWDLGLGKSIAVAIDYVSKTFNSIDAVLITLADQPLISSIFLEHLLCKFSLNKNKIVATSYGKGKYGVPVIFDKFYFKELTQLNNDEGAKHLLKKYKASVEVLNSTTENLDIDSKEDYNSLYRKKSKQ